ncbi:DNA-directed RNA polymerase I subunit RPA43 [Synchiropus splendidus]|uniref:DNA-directed RNA polymerase I subunit RPA43 n=1 Tax=Synchiropus splendidus TaxID=270530 RepID=UPI00237DE9DF|nr:DNA-directed RNA polymerase I subunit RPA43 [Synchiropus splendidus]
MSSEITAACPQVPPVGLQGNPVMHAGVLPCAVPSFADASKLLSAPYSCLVMHTHRKHVALPPMYLKKKRTGIEEELGSELLKFSQSFNGVPLAYDDVRIVGPHGDIHDDSGYIHMDIEANFILFRPQRGQKLVGKVNKLGESHVGCLVHSCFNASILKPRPVPLQTWLDFGPKIGDELEFDVTALDADTAGVLLIRGKLHSTRVQELMALGESSQSNADQAEPESEPESEQTTVTAHDSTDNTLKKEFKEEDSEVVIASSQDENTVPELNGTDETNGNDLSGKKKKKKKKKEKEVKAEPEDDSPSNSSGYRSDKPSKKRKHDVSMDINEVDDPPKSKKKKKKHDI